MSIQVQVALRSKKLGVLIRDARLAAHKTLSECEQLVGVSDDVLRSWEEGRKAPSLPELELLAYTFNQPLLQFWSRQAVSGDEPVTEARNLPILLSVRQRLVGACLRQQRENANLSITALSEQSGIPAERLNEYEMGELPIPLPELEGLVTLLGGKIETVFDQAGPIGKWMNQQKAAQAFLQLPPDLQDFASSPGNRPFLELAMQLSNMSADKLRSMVRILSEILSTYDNQTSSQS
jgi:transcriptional regulator with XRE-family HTH domain